MADDLPNILLIQADRLKPRVLPGYGGPAATPRLQRLCEEGMVFENAYCNFPLCAPSRFSMLAGMLPSRVRAFDNGAEFAAATPTMAHYTKVRDAGLMFGGITSCSPPARREGLGEGLSA